MDDTSEAGSRRYYELLRQRTPSERAAMVGSLNAGVRRMAEAGERASHPGASDREIEARVAARMYGRDVALRFFPGENVD
jgi:hypothetical protein